MSEDVFIDMLEDEPDETPMSNESQSHTPTPSLKTHCEHGRPWQYRCYDCLPSDATVPLCEEASETIGTDMFESSEYVHYNRAASIECRLKAAQARIT